MYHRTPLPEDVAHGVNVRPIKADLGDPSTLPPAVNSSKRCVDIGRVLESLFAIPSTTDLRFVGEMLPPLGGSESV